MPLNLDSCIAGVFIPGNIGASSGLPPVVRVMPPVEGHTEPTITSDATADNLEETLLAHALTADETVTWSIAGGADAAKFEISSSTLRWVGNGTKDFDAPDDADLTNTYEVTVGATNAAAFGTQQDIVITVTAPRSAMIVGPVFVNSDGTQRQANVDGVMVNL